MSKHAHCAPSRGATPVLAYVESSLPAGSAPLTLAARHGLALEIANTTRANGVDTDGYRHAGVRVITVQAWGMHELHPLHPVAENRRAATGHLLDSGEDLDAFFARWPHPVQELQLKGPLSTIPSPDDPLGSWFTCLEPPPASIAVEHRQPIEPADFERLIVTLRRRVTGSSKLEANAPEMA